MIERTSDGKFAAGRVSERRKDYSGMRFGALTVKEMIYTKTETKHITKAVCICDCGNEKTISVDSLKRSPFPSCGCLTNKLRNDKNRKDYTGLRFGRLTVLEMDYSSRPTLARCVCDCGNQVTVIATQLPNGKTKSCGCFHKEATAAHNTKDWSGFVSDYGVKIVKPHHQKEAGQWMWECQCGNCGSTFVALPAKIVSGHTTSCGCNNSSSGELLIKNVLNDNNIRYIPQFSFTDCKNKYVLKFDFAILDENETILFLIEYDGEQHYRPVEFFGGNTGFAETQMRDQIKNEYVKSHKIPLVRLPYTLSNDEITSIIIKHYKSVTTAGCSK